MTEERNLSGALPHMAENGYACFIITDLKRLLPSVLKHKPHHIILSLNSESDSVLTLPKTFKQLPDRIDTWFLVEVSNARTDARLGRIDHQNVIMPPLNGPSLLKRIRVRESMRPPQKKQSDSSRTADPNTELIFVKSKPKPTIIGRHLKDKALQESYQLQERAFDLAIKDLGPDALKVKEEEGSSHRKWIYGTVLRFEGRGGFLLLDSSAPFQGEKELFESHCKRMISYLNLSGESIESDEFFVFDVEPFDFLSLLRSRGAYWHTYSLMGYEIRMGFFECADVTQPMVELISKGMVEVPIESLNTEAPLPSDLFIEMKLNEKKLKLAKRGQKIDKERWPRLQRKGLTHVQVKRSEVRSLNAISAKEFLLKLIAEELNPSSLAPRRRGVG